MKKGKINIRSILIGFFLLFSIFLKAQDPQFGHFYNNAMLYNPAFAGNVDLGQFAFSYRNQWPGISGKFVSFAASYEHYFNKLNSGMGIQLVNDRAGSGGLTTTGANYLYSYQITINRQIALMIGLKAGFQSRFYDFNKFTFADQIARDDAPVSIVNNFRDRVNYANFGQGLVLYHREKFWFGTSFDHLNQPTNSFGSVDSKLPIRFSMQGGYNFGVNKNFNGRARGSLTTAFLYKSQLQWDQLDIGLYYKNDPVLFGLWYRGLPIKSNNSSLPNVDAILLLIGYKLDRISFAYSYDITISKLAGNTNGSHEISIAMQYPKSNTRRRRYYRVPCPKF